MTICEGGDGNGNYGNKMTFRGLMPIEGGFKLRGEVGHPSTTPDNAYGDSNAACGN